MFPGGIKRDQWYDMGWDRFNFFHELEEAPLKTAKRKDDPWGVTFSKVAGFSNLTKSNTPPWVFPHFAVLRGADHEAYLAVVLLFTLTRFNII